VTLSPHCFHTFKNDEPYASKNLIVQHFTEFAAEALKTGKIEITKKINKRITYHDPCFLGKRNEIYDPPRQILESIPGLEFVEMKRKKENSFCCGGGAGRTWTDDTKPENRPAVNRINEATDLGAELIVTACPFCISTLEDAIKVLDIEEKIEVKDISEILRETT
jgi:Fe-S oxidoreductase